MNSKSTLIIEITIDHEEAFNNPKKSFRHLVIAANAEIYAAIKDCKKVETRTIKLSN